jgi:hypothetical protein
MKKIKPYPETHQEGTILIENTDFLKISGDKHIKGDLGVQIAADGRIWVCINGVAFIRFSPHPDGRMKPSGD